jgi:hypothetical protein
MSTMPVFLMGWETLMLIWYNPIARTTLWWFLLVVHWKIHETFEGFVTKCTSFAATGKQHNTWPELWGLLKTLAHMKPGVFILNTEVSLPLMVKWIQKGSITELKVQQNLCTVRVLAFWRWLVIWHHHLLVVHLIYVIFATIDGVTVTQPLQNWFHSRGTLLFVMDGLVTGFDTYVLHQQAVATKHKNGHSNTVRVCVLCMYGVLVLFVAGFVFIMALSTPELQTTFVAVGVGEVDLCVNHCTSTLDTECPMWSFVLFELTTQIPAYLRNTDNVMCDSDCPVHRCMTHCHAAYNTHNTFIELTIVFARMLFERLSGIQTTLNFWSS